MGGSNGDGRDESRVAMDAVVGGLKASATREEGAKKRRRPADRSRVGDQDDNTKEKIDDGSGDDLRQTHVVANSTRSQISRTAGSDGVTKGGYNSNNEKEREEEKERTKHQRPEQTRQVKPGRKTRRQGRWRSRCDAMSRQWVEGDGMGSDAGKMLEGGSNESQAGGVPFLGSWYHAESSWASHTPATFSQPRWTAPVLQHAAPVQS